MIYDVITFGETMLRLTPPNLRRIEQATHYEVHIGGSESNVAVGLARLGLNVSWFSRITDNSLGHTIVNGIRAHGVDTSHVIWTDQDRVGLYFYEAGKAPRGSSVIYDRAGSAMSNMQADELPIGLFETKKSKLLHLSGITLAIGENAAQTAYEAAILAKKAGFSFSFDINYRALLSSPEKTAHDCHELASMADILFLPLRDAVSLYQTPNHAQDAVKTLSRLYPQAIIVMTLGREGAIAKEGDNIIQQSAFPAEELGRLGGGDSFVAGFLYAYLSSSNVIDALRWGAASAAYKYGIAGDMPILDKERITQMVNNEQIDKLLR